jgi:hypothetical protein
MRNFWCATADRGELAIEKYLAKWSVADTA